MQDFRLCHNVDENCTLLGYYTANSGNFSLTFRDNLYVPYSGVKILFRGQEGFLSPEDGTDRLSRNVAEKLPLLAAK
jgi:hypothetical protein